MPCSTREFRCDVNEFDKEFEVDELVDDEVDEFGEEEVDEELLFFECRFRKRLLYC